MTTKPQTGRRRASQPEGYTTIRPREAHSAAKTARKTARAQWNSSAVFNPLQRRKGRSGREEPVGSVGAVKLPQLVMSGLPGAGLIINRTGDRNFVVLVSNRLALVVAAFVSVLLALKASGQLGFITDLLKIFK